MQGVLVFGIQLQRLLVVLDGLVELLVAKSIYCQFEILFLGHRVILTPSRGHGIVPIPNSQLSSENENGGEWVSYETAPFPSVFKEGWLRDQEMLRSILSHA